MRYGNKAFRSWYDEVHKTMSDDIKKMYTDTTSYKGFEKAVPELKMYLEDSFGSPEKLDFHMLNELNFVIFIMCLFKMGILIEEDLKGTVG